MDVQELTSLFATTYSPDQNIRKAAEERIADVGDGEGIITASMQIIAQNNIDLAVRQACAVWMKNRLQNAYQLKAPSKAGTQPIPSSDRITLRQNILPLLVAAPSRAIRVQLTSCLKAVISEDYPGDWPNLLEEILAMLKSDDLPTIYGGLLAILEVIRSLKYRLSSNSLPEIVQKLFPILVVLGQKLVSTNPPPQISPPQISPLECAEFLHLITKAYYASTVNALTVHQQTPESIVPWGTLLFQVVNMQLPAGTALPGTDADWEKHAWWKAKKWAYRTLNRLFDRFGNPSQLPKPMKKDYLAFANHFVTTFAPEIFKMYLTQVELWIGGAWMSKSCLNMIFSFFTSCVKPKSTWQLLKPHITTLFSRFIFPQLCFTPERAELWETDPVEYVRSSMEEYDDFSTPRSMASSFMFSLASKRSKAAFMPMLTFVNAILAGNPKPEEKYGALTVIVALGSMIMTHPEVKPRMETFCVNHVLPEFSSPHAYMREVACQVIGTLSSFDLEWEDPKHHEAFFQALGRALDDPELAVRVAGAISLTEIIQDEDVQKALAPNIEKIMQALFKLSDETDMDMLSTCMETFIEVFKEQLLPLAPQIIARLCETYSRLLSEQIAVVETEANTNPTDKLPATVDDKTFALIGTTKTIQTILGCLDEVENSQPVIAEIIVVVLPIIMQTLQSTVLDVYDSAWDLTDALTFRARGIPATFWPVYERTYQLFKSSAVDYLQEMLPALCNFLLFGKETFIQNPEYIRMALDIFQTSFTNPHLGEQDASQGCKLVESVLLNLKGHIDEAIPAIVQTALDALTKPPETAPLKLATINVLVTAVWYNPILTIHALEAMPGGSRVFFDKWFMAVSSEAGLPRVHDKKLSILALCELFKLDPAAVPPSLKDGWNGLVGGILSLFKGLPEAEAKRDAMLAAFDDDEDEDSEDMDIHEEAEGDDDGDVWDEDSAYLELLAEERERLNAKHAARNSKPAKKEAEIEAEADLDVDDDDDDDDEADIGPVSISEDLGIETIIDELDPYTHLKQSLTGLQMSNPGFYQALTTSLSMDQQTELMSVMATAEKHEKGEIDSEPESPSS